MLQAAGTGGNFDFTPQSRQFPGVLVIFETFQLGALAPAPIAQHIQDLSGLTPVAFYIDMAQCAAGAEIAP